MAEEPLVTVRLGEAPNQRSLLALGGLAVVGSAALSVFSPPHTMAEACTAARKVTKIYYQHLSFFTDPGWHTGDIMITL